MGPPDSSRTSVLKIMASNPTPPPPVFPDASASKKQESIACTYKNKKHILAIMSSSWKYINNN